MSIDLVEVLTQTLVIEVLLGIPGPPGGGEGGAGTDGDNGWSPILAVVSDGERRVAQVVDWTGGEGTKPAVGSYVGAAGLVAAIGDAVDIRGAAGAGATPAGSGTELQYRDGSVLGAVAGSSWDGTTLQLPAIASGAEFSTSAGFVVSNVPGGVPRIFARLAAGVAVASGYYIGWGDATAISGPGTAMYRDGETGAIALRYGSAAHQLRIYGTYTNASNYERIALSASGVALESAGTGSANRTLTLSAQGTGVIACTSPVRVPSYTVATVPSASVAGAGAMIFVTDEFGGPVLAMSDGADWRRVTDYAVIS